MSAWETVGPLDLPRRAARCGCHWLGLRPQVLLLAALALGLGQFWHHRFATSVVVGDSMQPTLATGDLLLISKSAMEHQEPQRGDLLVVRYLGDWIVKRVVGLPGEEVRVLQGVVVVDGTRIPESYRVRSGSLSVESGRLRAGRYAVLGDNRDLPNGQSVHAVISKDQIVGKVIFSFPSGRLRMAGAWAISMRW